MPTIWIDTDIGTNPDDATALIFALRHPDIDVAGISISGTQQERRRDEALAVLEHCNKDVQVLLGSEVTSQHMNDAHVHHTIAIGPLTNISRLILDEALLGKLHFMGGAFSAVEYRGNSVTRETNSCKDQEATRITLSQYHNVCISSLDATHRLILDPATRETIESKHPFLKSRYEGYSQHLATKFDPEHSQIVLHDVLPICDILNTVSITREVIEFYIQADGTFRSVHPLSSVMDPIEEVTDNPDSLPVPKVKHEVIRTLSSHLVLEEVVANI
jgi:inosine-uridine nucleoside N-ribohydrolase